MAKRKKTDKSSGMTKDPHFARESEKYDNPIPSREFILEYLEKIGGPLKFKAVQHHFELFDVEQETALSRRLRAMERDGQLHCDRRGAYGIVDKLDLVPGKILGHRDGFGFFVPDQVEPKSKTPSKSKSLKNRKSPKDQKSHKQDWFVSAREMRKVFPGERVLVRQKNQSSDGRIEAQVVEVLPSDEPLKIVGRYFIESGITFVTPEDPRISQDILIPPDDPLKAKHGQVVVAQIKTRPTYRSKAVGTLVQVLGDYLDPGMEIKIAISQFSIRDTWPQEVHDQLQQLPLEVETKDSQDRVDLRDLPLITIDGEDARDFDDAVYCQPTQSGGWKLWVAIADVSHYVLPDSSLDIEAVKRGNSVYFPNAVVPMLPEQISNGLCSLKPEVDRLCMVCEMSLTAKGVVSRSKFYPAVMHSKARMTYNKVWSILQGDEMLCQQYADIVKPIHQLYDLFKARTALKKQRGAIDFDTTETQIIFNENRKIEKIVPVVRNDAHRIIEECMICANVASAKFLIKNKAAGLYRVHLGPQEKKLEVLRQYLAGLGFFITGGEDPTPKVFQQLLTEIKDRPDADNIQIMLLRSMSQAEYSPDNQGHFGLAFDAYTHFTSPIRRYPDLIVHRLIKAIVSQEKDKQEKSLLKYYDKSKLAQIGQTSSATERNADMATRQVMDWLKCEYMQAHIGNEYLGEVSSVTSFGIFVRLNEVFVEGLVHVTELGSDYFHYDSASQSMIGERTKQRFSIGDQLKIQVSQVNMEQRRIDFSLVELGEKQNSSKKKMAKKSEFEKKKPKKNKLTEREKLYAQAKKRSSKSNTKKSSEGKKASPKRKVKAKPKSVSKPQPKSKSKKK